jgi:dTDP-4-dehydrorhamnose 3,5-epimerase
MLKQGDSILDNAGELYFSEVNPQAVKAWKLHSRQTQNITVPAGELELVMYDDREKSSSRGTIDIINLGRPDNYVLVTIPPQIWYGFRTISASPALIANCTDIPHDPSEISRLPPDSDLIPHRWKNPR